MSEWIDMGSRRIRVYPDTPENIVTLAEQAGMKTNKIVEIENAYLLVLRYICKIASQEKMNQKCRVFRETVLNVPKEDAR